MKKLLVLSLIGGIILTGCGSSSNGGEEEKKESEGTVIEVAVDKGYVEYFETVAEDYVAANEGVTIEVIESDMFAAIESVEAQKGNSVDVFMMPNDRIGDLASKKLITPFEVDLSGYTETAQTAAVYNDEQYFVPTSTDTTLLYYNKANVSEEPATLKELGPEKFVAKFTDFYFTAGMFYSNGGYIFGDDVSDIGLANEGSVKAGEAIQGLYGSGVADWEALKEEQAGYDLLVQNFMDGNVDYYIDGPWKYTDLTAGMDAENLGVMPIPSWDGTATYQPLAGTKGMGVNAYSAEKEEAIKFVQHLANDELAAKFYEATNEVNPNVSIEYPEGSLQEVVLEATSIATPMPTDPAFGKVWEPMADALKQIANGEDVQSALDAAVVTIEAEIAALNN